MKKYTSTKRLCSLLLLMAAGPVLAKAQQADAVKNLELSISETISYYSKKNFQIGSPQSSTPIDGSMQIRSNNRHEFRFNFLTSGRFGTEGFYSYESTSVDFARSTPPADNLSIPLDIHHFGVNVLFYPFKTETSKWLPYASVGGGAMLYRPTAGGQDIATDPLRGNLPSFFESSRGAINFSAGVKRSLSRSFGLRFDAGSVLTPAPTFGLPTSSTDPNAAVLPISGRVNNPHASVGIILYLGR